MKKIFSSFFIVLLTGFYFAQAPAGYYNGTAGLSGAALKTKLHQIISTGAYVKSYDQLYTAYQTTDRDYFFENDGTILDIYSENPTATDPYNYVLGQNCGIYNSEGDCFNREHIVPQSMFNSASPMVSDVHFIRPTDGKVNGMRSNYPFGKVGVSSYVSMNGSKLGSSVSPGYSGTVFEPIDAFKGDVARMIFYFVTRYQDKLVGWGTTSMLAGNTYPGMPVWEVQQLLAWNALDPVSPEETARNNASYTYQNNRNPFIDNAQWAVEIWGATDAVPPTPPTALTVTTVSSNSVALSWTAATDNNGIAGYDIYVNGTLYTTVSSTTATVNGLAPLTTYTFYVIAKDLAGNASPQSNTVTATTADGPAGGGSCGTENFETIPTDNASSYATRTWTNNNITWTATDSRTDETMASGKAITVRNGSLTSSTLTGGISSITLSTQLKYSGSDGSLNILINGITVGTVPYNAAATTTTISNLNITGNAVISVVQPVSGNRVAIDNLSWSCYTLGTAENENSPAITIYPSPVRNGEVYFKGKNLSSVASVRVYDLSGKLIREIARPFRNSDKIQLNGLPAGVYLIKADETVLKIKFE